MPDLGNIVSGTMLMIDKPLGWTSFDVVNKLRNCIRSTFDLKKIKVGHAGTLDPLATGLLIICTGKMTKEIDGFQAQHKSYDGVLHLGKSTPTYDAEMEPDQEYAFEHITHEMMELQAQKMTGLIQQRPPIFSAIKKDGVPLYKSARAGKVVDVPHRQVEIMRFDIKDISMPEVGFTVECSKGTYIRSLAHDFGQALDSGAYLKSLTRTAIGDYQLSDAWQLPELLNSIIALRA